MHIWRFEPVPSLLKPVLGLCGTGSFVTTIWCVREARRALSHAKTVEARAKLENLHPESIYKQQQSAAHTKKMRQKFYTMSRENHKAKLQKDRDKLEAMTTADKSKFMHSRIKQATAPLDSIKAQASYATMDFEGRRVSATNPDQIKHLLGY